MLIQEKPFFHQRHLRTRVNGIFSTHWSLFSLCTATCILMPWCRRYWKCGVLRKFERSRNFLQRSRFFLTETYVSEKIIQSENLSMSEFNPLTFILITYKSGLLFCHLIWCFLDSTSIPMFSCSYSMGVFFFLLLCWLLLGWLSLFILFYHHSSLKLFLFF